MTFGRCVKAICSEWDFDELAPSMDIKGNHYRTFYIKTGLARVPTLAECLAIADYSGMRYHKGFFYKKII